MLVVNAEPTQLVTGDDHGRSDEGSAPRRRAAIVENYSDSPRP